MSTRSLVRIALAVVLYPAVLFGCAGTLAWPAGWVFLALYTATNVGMLLYLKRHDPALLAERLKPVFQPGQPTWDRVILALTLVTMLVWFVLPPLDHRFGWSTAPLTIQVAGGVLFLLGAWGLHRTICANTFLAPVVRVQTERDHHVIDTGPYAVVRHPMYAFMGLYMPGGALLMGSWVGTVFCVVPLGLLAVRTALEDRMLQRELSGYPDYAARVRWKLVPGVW